MGHSSSQKRPHEIQLGMRSPSALAVLIRAAQIQRIITNMNAIESEVPVAEVPLPESHRDLELLLEALHALNDALDQYETEETVNT